MNISAWFIRRPIATTLLFIGICAIGLTSYALIPIAGIPQVDLPAIEVRASLPGASADTMATSVATPLERQLSKIPGVSALTSTSSLGHTKIEVSFDLNRNIDGAAQDVQAAINAASGQLPKDLPYPPVYEKAHSADALLLSVAVTSDSFPISKVDDYAENYIAPRLAHIEGVGLVDYHGQQKPAVRVQINPVSATALGIGLEDVRAALASATLNAPKGTLQSPQQSLTLDATDQLLDAAAFDKVIIAYHSGAPVRIKDIGRAVNGVENVHEAAWVGDKRAVILDVHKQAGFNINATVQRIKDVLPSLQRFLPPSIHLRLLDDRTQTIRAAVAGVQTTIAISIGLVVLVVFLFLRHPYATAIPSVTIPISLLGTVAVMYWAGYTLDNVSLMGLTIAVGFIIDDGIVMIENIVRHLEAGVPPLAAALHGAREISFTVISMTLSLVAVFIPLLLMGGLIGRLFREFAISVSIAILISGLVSLTLTPMMASRLLKPDTVRKVSPLNTRLTKGFERAAKLYERSLDWALGHRPVLIGALIAALTLSVVLYIAIPKDFFPQQDNGVILCTTEAAQDISYPAMVERERAMVKVVRADPDVQAVYYWVGAHPSINTGSILMDLKPFSQRSSSAQAVLARLRKASHHVEGLGLYCHPRQGIEIGTKVSKTEYQYTLQDPNVSDLLKWTPRILAKLKTLPDLQDVSADLQTTAPRETIKIDREMLGRLGITSQAIDNTLYDAFGQRQVATIYTELGEHHVILEFEPRFQQYASALNRLYLRSGSGSGNMVPLSAMAHFERSVAPLTINHDDQLPATTISFNLMPGHSLGQAVAAIGRIEQGLHKPEALTAHFTGTAKVFQSSLASQPYLIGAAVLAVYIVLGILYESFFYPLVILSALPSAGVGAFVALMLLGYNFSLIALIGVIMLVGIVKKNAIMMIDVALDAERNHNVPAELAIREAALRRFRPIMMTTVAALLGGLPLALAIGAGSELRRPLGIVIVGGLLLSQLLTLYTTPIIYLYIGQFDVWLQSATNSARLMLAQSKSLK